jgi:hypothetical protein
MYQPANHENEVHSEGTPSAISISGSLAPCSCPQNGLHEGFHKFYSVQNLTRSQLSDYQFELLSHDGSPYLNVFLIWNSHRDEWSFVYDRVIESILCNICNARVIVFSNTLPRTFFAGLQRRGSRIALVSYDVLSVSDFSLGQTWIKQCLSQNSQHQATHISDYLRIVLLFKFGGLYLDADALMLRGIESLPSNFIGMIDFLKLEPQCNWCIDKKWYLANGVLKFEKQHPFLKKILEIIEGTVYDKTQRTAIGPQLLTSAFLKNLDLTSDVVLLPEEILYPIAGPSIPDYIQEGSSLKMLPCSSRSVHLFWHTFKNNVIFENSLIAQVLRRHNLEHDCFCEFWDTSSLGSVCLPKSIVIEHQENQGEWFLPTGRICIVFRPISATAQSVVASISSKNGLVRSLFTPLAVSFQGPFESNRHIFESLVYAHRGGYCNDELTFSVSDSDNGVSSSWKIFVSAPCIVQLSKQIADPLKSSIPSFWNSQIGPEVSSITLSDFEFFPELAHDFKRCLKVTPRQKSSLKIRTVGLIVSASGSYVTWLDDFILSAETHFFHLYEVHYFLLTDKKDSNLEPRERIHILHQPVLGWPLDSMLRHQLYLKHFESFKDIDMLAVLDADTKFVRPVGIEIFGRTFGAMQSFFFGQPVENAPFETGDRNSSAYVEVQHSSCYFAGGFFGGTPGGFFELLSKTVWLMEWDIFNLGKTAPHDDESYLNKVFSVESPEVVLSANYIFPEPPADKMWGLRGYNWKEAFPPKIMNLGARKWLGQSASADRSPRKSDVASFLRPIPPRESARGISVVICSRQLNYAIIQRILTSFERFHAVEFQITFIISSSDKSLLDFADSRISFVTEPDEHYSLDSCSTASWKVAVDRSRFQLVLMLGHSMSLTWQNDLNFAASALKSISSLDLDKIHAVGFCGTPTRKDGLNDCLRYPSHCMICETLLMRDKPMFVKVEMGRRFECYESSKNNYQAFLLGKASANKLLRRYGTQSSSLKFDRLFSYVDAHVLSCFPNLQSFSV